jgi:hypothetical protein
MGLRPETAAAKAAVVGVAAKTAVKAAGGAMKAAPGLDFLEDDRRAKQ